MTPQQLHNIPRNQLRDIARNMLIEHAIDIEHLSIFENLKYNLGVDDPDGSYAAQIQTLLDTATITVTWPELSTPPAEPPRVSWDLPSEPGPEVRAVRGRSGKLILRAEEPGFWCLDGQLTPHAWSTVLSYEAPLTDATTEVTACPATR